MSLFVAYSGAVNAQMNKETEINYLLKYIGNSGCVFMRNGNEHDSQDARKHMYRTPSSFLVTDIWASSSRLHQGQTIPFLVSPTAKSSASISTSLRLLINLYPDSI